MVSLSIIPIEVEFKLPSTGRHACGLSVPEDLQPKQIPKSRSGRFKCYREIPVPGVPSGLPGFAHMTCTTPIARSRNAASQ